MESPSGERGRGVAPSLTSQFAAGQSVKMGDVREITLDATGSTVLFSRYVVPRQLLRLLLHRDPIPGPKLEACARLTTVD